MKEQAQLVIRLSAQHEVVYQCSLCGHTFPLTGDEPPKESMTRLWAAFKEHVRTSHCDEVISSERPDEGGRRSD